MSAGPDQPKRRTETTTIRNPNRPLGNGAGGALAQSVGTMIQQSTQGPTTTTDPETGEVFVVPNTAVGDFAGTLMNGVFGPGAVGEGALSGEPRDSMANFYNTTPIFPTGDNQFQEQVINRLQQSLLGKRLGAAGSQVGGGRNHMQNGIFAPNDNGSGTILGG